MNLSKIKIEAAINVWEYFFSNSFPITYESIFQVVEKEPYFLEELLKRYDYDVTEYRLGIPEKIISENERALKAFENFLSPGSPFKDFQFTTGWIEEHEDGSRTKEVISKNVIPPIISEYLQIKIRDLYSTEIHKVYFKTILSNVEHELTGKKSNVDRWMFRPTEPKGGYGPRDKFVHDQYYVLIEYMIKEDLRKGRFESDQGLKIINQIFTEGPTDVDIEVLLNFEMNIDPVFADEFTSYAKQVLNTSEKLSSLKIRKAFIINYFDIAKNKIIEYTNTASFMPSLLWFENMWTEIFKSNHSAPPIKARYYALYHWLLIKFGMANLVERNINDLWPKKEIIQIAENIYSLTDGQGFYRAFIDTDITSPLIIEQTFGKGYKDIVIKISNNNSDFIKKLDSLNN